MILLLNIIQKHVVSITDSFKKLQLLKEVYIPTLLPLKSSQLTRLPSLSVSVNGPPMAAPSSRAPVTCGSCVACGEQAERERAKAERASAKIGLVMACRFMLC